MGACQSRGNQEVAVEAPQRIKSVKVCDDSLEDAVIAIPETSYGVFNRVALNWDTLGQLIPYEGEDGGAKDGKPAREAVAEFDAIRRQRTSAKPRANFTTDHDDGATSSLQRAGSAAMDRGRQSIGDFKRAVERWTNFKISSKALQHLHNMTDAWSYFDKENVPLPRELFASHGSDSISELQGSQSSSARSGPQPETPEAPAPSSRENSVAPLSSHPSLRSTKTTSISAKSASIGTEQQPSPIETHRTPEPDGDEPKADEPRGDEPPRDWLNYELVLRPYLNEDKTRHLYTCVYRPRRETSPRDRPYSIDESLMQLLGDVLDPFQLQHEDAHRQKLIESVKQLLRTSAENFSLDLSATVDYARMAQRPVRRMTRRPTRGSFNLRALSTISNAGDSYEECRIPATEECLDQVYNVVGNVPCHDGRRRELDKRQSSASGRKGRAESRFGDMSDIPLLI
ncbi:histidinol dehydrogenase [Babesia caballi]|uniref:Histidinol dehydrogenase n=1 Tax=Babesia caballi TaxID=5871 RepID=A0AAV4LU26_BABCB|nr:histidinol dehydrogenase [Babesia caballi]